MTADAPMTANELNELQAVYDAHVRLPHGKYTTQLLAALPQLIALARDGLALRSMAALAQVKLVALEETKGFEYHYFRVLLNSIKAERSDAARAATEGDEHGE